MTREPPTSTLCRPAPSPTGIKMRSSRGSRELGDPERLPGRRPGRIPRAACAALLALSSLSAAPGCGSDKPARGPDQIQRELESVRTRLRGRWRAENFTPEQALDPVMQAMLQGLYGSMVITFDGQRVVADAPGIHFDRRYEVNDVVGDQFKLVAYEEGGLAYESFGEFRPGGELVLRVVTPPWKGTGTMRRIGDL